MIVGLSIQSTSRDDLKGNLHTVGQCSHVNYRRRRKKTVGNRTTMKVDLSLRSNQCPTSSIQDQNRTRMTEHSPKKVQWGNSLAWGLTRRVLAVSTLGRRGGTMCTSLCARRIEVWTLYQIHREGNGQVPRSTFGLLGII